MNGSGGKKPQNVSIEPARTGVMPGDLDTDEDWSELRRERRISDEAMNELDSLLPDADRETSPDVLQDFDDEGEATQAGQGSAQRRRTITLTGEEAPEFPAREPTSKVGRAAHELAEAAEGLAEASDKVLGKWQGNAWRYAVLVTALFFALLFFAIWQLKEQLPLIIRAPAGTPIDVQQVKPH